MRRLVPMYWKFSVLTTSSFSPALPFTLWAPSIGTGAASSSPLRRAASMVF